MSGQQLPPGMKLTPEMASAAAAGMSSMSPDDMDRMADALESGAAPPGDFGGFGGAGPPAGGMADAMRMMQVLHACCLVVRSMWPVSMCGLW